MHLPLGQLHSCLSSTPVALAAARLKERAAALGFNVNTAVLSDGNMLPRSFDRSCQNTGASQTTQDERAFTPPPRVSNDNSQLHDETSHSSHVLPENDRANETQLCARCFESIQLESRLICFRRDRPEPLGIHPALGAW